MQRIRELFMRAALQKELALPKEDSRRNPGHISQEMQTALLDRMSRGRNRRKLLDRTSRSRHRSLTADDIKAGRKSSIRNRTPLDRVRKGLRTQIQAVRRKLIFHRKTAPLRRKMAKSRRKGSRKMITAAGTPTANRKKREDTAGGSIRTGSEPRTLILSVTFRRRTQPLQREPIQSFMAARS